MLVEMLEYRLTPDGPLGRDYDYLGQAVSLGARYRRQRRAWAPHVAQCHAFIAEAASAAGSGRALVVGSGRLIEIPLRFLADRFAEVVLLDVVHPLITRRLARRHRGVRLMTADVTGTLAALSSALRNGRPLPDPATAPLPLSGERFDFVVSANLASQLPLFPTQAIEERRPDVDEAARELFGRALIERHFAWLRGLAPVAAAFSDIDSRWTDAGGREVQRRTTLWNAEPPPADRTWEWLIAPRPEEERDYDLRHTVAAWRNLADVADVRGNAINPP